jgi:type VI secretion system protein ImpF
MKREIDRAVQQSLLDRLIDLEPATGDGRIGFRESVRQMKLSVQRDLDWLLNTRRPPEELPEGMSELRRSLVVYGLPDITSMSKDAPDTRPNLLREVKQAIQIFEPRLMNVKVSLVETTDETRERRELRFIIEAVLRMDPTPEQVVFDTVLHISSGEYQVRGSASA